MREPSPTFEPLTARESIARYEQAMGEVPGWLDATDFVVLRVIDEMQQVVGLGGDLLEIGVYQGRTAILLQWFCRGNERLSVCDVFESPTGDDEEERARDVFYTDLRRETFERHFLEFHLELPEIHQCRSQELAGRLRGRSFRIVHVDGSHIHAAVRSDLELAKRLLAPGGIVAVDDYRREHTPGVAAAVWEQVVNGGLVPICLTAGKLYGCWQHAEWYSRRMRDLAGANPGLRLEVAMLVGREVLRLSDSTIEGPSREEFLATQLAVLRREHAALLEAARSQAERAQLEIESGRSELAATRRQLDAARREIEARTIELARRELRRQDLELHVRLLESAVDVRGNGK